jgi:hypothetical protein
MAEPSKPKLQTCYASDTTVESLKLLLSDDHNDDPRGILLYFDELAGFTNSLNQYKTGGNDRQFYLSLYDGGFIRVDRKKDGDPSIIRRTGLSICGGIQPHLLPKVFGNGDDGLTPRFQVVAYPKPYGKVGASAVQADNAAKADVKRRLYDMRDAQPLPSPERNDGLKPFGQPLRFDASAQTFFDNYVIANRNRHEAGIFAAHIEKQRAALARIALVLHGMKHGHAMRDNEIGLDTLRAAWDLINYFEAHARRLYGVTEAVEAKAGALRIARWIKADKKTSFVTREIVRKDWKEFSKTRNYEAILASVEYLEAHGWLRLEHKAGGPRGQSGWSATVNPDVLATCH